MFQSTLPRRERHFYGMAGNSFAVFQSTLPRRERLWSGAKKAWKKVSFNPRSHAGSDAVARYNHSYSQGFNPRSHAGSDWSGAKKAWKKVSFNPRSHAGSDLLWDGWKQFCGVSIHAPTQGATCMYGIYCTLHNVSIHAPTQGATQQKDLIQSVSMVSIHAPTQGATAISAKNSSSFSAEIDKLSF